MNSLQRVSLTLGLLLAVLSGAAGAQMAGVKSYATQEEYCRDNPKAPTCINGKPFKMLDLSKANPALDYCQKHPKSSNCTYSIFNNNGSASKSSSSAGPAVLTTSEAKQHVLGPPIKDVAAAWRFAHPNADVVVGINAASLRQSATLRALIAKLAGPLGVKPVDLENYLAQSNDIDQCWLSLRSGDSLVLLQGRTDFPAGFVELADGMTSYRISKTAVVLGKRASVSAAVQRLLHAGGIESATTRQMNQLGADNDLWVAGTRAFLQQPQMTQLYEGLSGYSLGISLRDGLSLGLKLKYATLDKARRVMTSLRGAPPLPESLVKLSSEIEGSTVHVSFAVEQAQLLAAVDRALAQPWGKKLTAMAAKSIATADETVIYGQPGGPKHITPSKAAPAPPGKMVIYGLKGGPKVM